MKKTVTAVVFILLLCTIASGHAQIRQGGYTVTPFIGGYAFESSEDLENAFTFGLRGGYHFTYNWGIEGFLNYAQTENAVLPGDLNVDLLSYGIEGLYHFMPDSRLVPFLAVGVGGNHYDGTGGIGDRNKFLAQYGAGLKYFITENTAVRADIRHVMPFNERYNDVLYSIGLNYLFGGEKRPEARAAAFNIPDTDGDGVPDYMDKCPETPAGVKVDEFGCPPEPEPEPVGAAAFDIPDTDGDGVPDYLDKCPETPAGVKVDEFGCPPEPEPEPVGAAAFDIPDTDGDGVPDYMDKCPETPAGVKVDEFGCPPEPEPEPVGAAAFDIPDTDGDGVPDYMDKCPETPAGVKVDEFGCPPPEEKPAAAVMEEAIMEKGRVTLNVEFDFDKAVVKPQYHDEIANLAEVMKNHPELTITIEGHTDSVGPASYNQKLSERRANAVKKVLVETFGIDENRLTAVGYGESRPIASNTTKEGRQQNRRVEAAAEYTITK